MRVRLSTEVLSQEVSGETVLLHLENENYYGLDPVATRVWQLLREHEDLDAVYRAMLDEFDVDPATLKGDLEAHLDDLQRAGLVTLSTT